MRTPHIIRALVNHRRRQENASSSANGALDAKRIIVAGESGGGNLNLLVTLLRAPLKAFTRAELLEGCLPDSEALEGVIDAHVHNLRKKLEKHGIRNVLTTVRSVGYRFQETPM